MKQKFFRGQLVRLADDFGRSMSHFTGKGGMAIVQYSYSDHYGMGNYSDYSLLLLSGEDKGVYPYSSSWYHENQMTLISDDRVAGEKALQMYREFLDRYGDTGSLTTYNKAKKQLLNNIQDLYGKEVYNAKTK